MNKIKLYWSLFSEYLYLAGLGILVFLLVGLFLSIPLCLLWNWLMPFIFGLPKLNLLQTFGLSVMISLLAPRKIDLGKKEKPNKIDEDLNKNLEDLLQNLSSNFRA